MPERYATPQQAPFMRLITSLKASLQEIDATDVKKSFEKQIESKRTLSKIRNLADLIDVLVRHDIVCEEYVDPLKLLAVNNPEQINNIICYEKFHVTDKCCTMCKLSLVIDAVPIAQERAMPNPTAPQPLNNGMDDQHKEFHQVIRYLSDRLGGENWVHLARKIDFPEYQIKNIKENYPNECAERCYQMLWKWKEENGDDATVERITSALGRGQLIRRDLVMDIQKGKHLKY